MPLRTILSRLGVWLAFGSLLVVSAAQGQVQLIEENGVLIGAKNVEVSGAKFNLLFKDGTCVLLFGGCNSAGDFVFQTDVSAIAASNALANQVFTGDYDLFPQRTAGCANTFPDCQVMTPFVVFAETLDVSFVDNHHGFDPDLIALSTRSRFQDTGDYVDQVYAVWAPIPELGTQALLGAGLMLLAAVRRRHQRDI